MLTAKQISITLGSLILLALIGGALWWSQTADTESQSAWQEANLSKQAISLGESAPTYTNEQYGFSLKYPPNFHVGEFSNGTNTSVVLQNTESRTGFQIYIKPIEENLTLTESKLRQQVPDINVSDVKPTTVAGTDNALAFNAQNDAFGQSAEIWFVKDKTLFQLSTYREQQKLLQQVVETWKFE